MALTDTAARRAKPTEKPYKLADSGGLYLAVMSEGGKLWRWKYRFEAQREADGHRQLPGCIAGDRHASAIPKPTAARCRRRPDGHGVRQERSAKHGQIENAFETIAQRWLDHWKEDKSLRHVDYKPTA